MDAPARRAALFFAAFGPPWEPAGVGHDVLNEWSGRCCSLMEHGVFLVLYANAGGWTCRRAGFRASGGGSYLIDRWMLGELHAVVRDVTASLEDFDTAAAGRRLATLIDDLSNWYVRRSRRRFWGPGFCRGCLGVRHTVRVRDHANVADGASCRS